jgi:DNA polymerase I-like protein with 3'-5' exonuclease and polymerase domains
VHTTEFDIETTGLDPRKDQIVSYQVGGAFIDSRSPDQLGLFLDTIASPYTEKVIHNAHFEYKWMLVKHKRRMLNYQDSQLAAFLTLTKARVPKVDAETGEKFIVSSVALKPLCQSLFGMDVSEFEEFKQYGGIVGVTRHLYLGEPLKNAKGITDDALYEQFIKYALKDNILSRRVWDHCTKLPEWQLVKGVYDTEIKLIPVIVDMELVGMRLDREAIDQRISEVEAMLHVHETSLKSVLGDDLNLKSRDVGDRLRSHASVPLVSLSADGHYRSDSKYTLPKYANFPIVKELMVYRKLQWTLSTCLKRWKEEGDHIYTNINAMGANHGRLSSNDPNLMNIPKRGTPGYLLEGMSDSQKKTNEYAADLRKFFIPHEGFTYYMFDWSQIELVIAAFYTRDLPFINALKENQDVHRLTAAVALGIDPNEVTEKQRSDFKENTYGILYGSGAKAIAERMVNVGRMSYGDAYPIAKSQYKGFFEAHPALRRCNDQIRDLLLTDEQIREEHEATQKRQRKNGGVIWDFNYRRTTEYRGYLKNCFGRIWKPDTPSQHYKGLEALASGTATGDMLKRVLCTLYYATLKGKESRLVLPVHDEIILEIKDGEEKELVPEIKRVMEDWPEINKVVPIRVDIERSKVNWKEKEKVYDSKKEEWLIQL